MTIPPRCSRHASVAITVLVALALSGCQSSPPQAVDGDLRLAASAFGSALSDADASSIAALSATSAGSARIHAFIQLYGGHPTQPVGYDSIDQPGKAVIEFDVQCPVGDRRFSLGYSWDRGTWRPVIGAPTDAQASSNPNASGPLTSGTDEAICG